MVRRKYALLYLVTKVDKIRKGIIIVLRVNVRRVYVRKRS